MNAGQLQSLKELIEFLKRQEVGEFELQQEDLKVRLSFIGKGSSEIFAGPGRTTPPSLPSAGTASPSPGRAGAAAPSGGPASVEASASDEDLETGLHIVKSPIVGTFYEAPAPGAEPFVKIGDQVEAGQVICIVEAMKLMNEIESDASGEIVRRMVTSGQPVEYGQALFAIRPR